MSMSIRHKRLSELKQSGQVAEFRLSDGTTIVGVVQDFDANNVCIVSGGAKRSIAQSAIAQINISGSSGASHKPAAGASVPRDGGYYAHAKRAESKRDFAAAEEYFRKAIENDDRAESAVKDLASLLDRQGRTEEAIQELETFLRQKRVSNQLSFRNQLIMLYQRVGNYARAIELIDENLPALPPKRRRNFLLQKARCQMQLNQVKEASETLEQAKVPEISPFLRFYMDRCTYEGIPDARRNTRVFTKKDFKKLRGLINSAGQKRPSQRAELYLTQAAVAERLGKETYEVLNPLNKYALNMAEASAIEGKHPDVIGAYLSSAVLTASKMSGTLEKALNDYLSRIASVRADQLTQTLNQIIASQHAIAFEWLLEASLSAPIFSETILLVASWSRLAREFCELCRRYAPALKVPCDIREAWQKACDAIRQRRDHVCREFEYLRSIAADLSTIEEQRSRLNELRSHLRSELDQGRLQRIAEIQGQVILYTKQNSYDDREYLADNIVGITIPDLLREIEANPTIYSVEQFYGYLEALRKALRDDFEQIQRQAEPQELPCKLAVERYPDQEEISCQIEISNVEGKSPVSELVVHVVTSPNDEYQPLQPSIPIDGTLKGGRSVICQVPIRLTPAARKAQVLTLHYDLSYKLRSGRQARQTGLTLPIRLHKAEDFDRIPNPYAVYANSGPVEDDKMFYGRARLIENLIEAILSAPTSKSVVIFGQKRAGKSSILYHLKRRLPRQFIPIQFSIGDIENDLSVRTFLYRIIQKLSNVLEERFPEAFELAERPKLSDLSDSPELIFYDYMDSTLRRLKAIQPEARLILLIDEFTYLYSGIQAGTLPHTFMRFWKALTERGYFSTVLVGQDSMPRFMEAFPNEFQVAQPERVTYLAEEDARGLIVNPIRIPETGESRYRGRAVERLLQLTAGSPYYIQIFCNRLVEYMNKNKIIYVTDADIERVKQELLRGQNRLTDGEFDNLLSSADEHTDLIPAADARAVLTQIARHTRYQDWCDAGRIQAHTSKPLAEVLEDLVRRDVLEKQNDSYRIRVGLFKEWLLEN